MFKTNSEILVYLINLFNCKKIAEIGVSRGLTSLYVLKNCSHIETYFMIDPNSEALDNTILKIFNKAIFLKEYSNKAVKNFDDFSLDLVYIDAQHDYEAVKEDINLWYPKVKQNGILCGHDYTLSEPCCGVIKAVNEKFSFINLIEEENGNKTWWFKKE